MPITVPLINGNRYEYASIIANIGGLLFSGIKSITYKQEKKRGKMYGTGVVKGGRTRGQLVPSASIEWYKEEYDLALAALVAQGLGLRGYMDVEFPVVVTYEEIQNGFPTLITDELVSCVIDNEEDDHSEGTDPLTVKTDLDLFWILRNGKAAVIEIPLAL